MSKTTTKEGNFMKTWEARESFYTEKDQKTMTALASFYGRIIKTEKLIVISIGEGGTPEAKNLTKVTILG